MSSYYLRREGRQPEVAPQSIQPEVKEDDFGVGVDLVQLLQVRQLLAREYQGHVNVGPFYRLVIIYFTRTEVCWGSRRGATVTAMHGCSAIPYTLGSLQIGAEHIDLT